MTEEHLDKLRIELKEHYNRFLEDFGMEPAVAICHVKWKDDHKHEVVKIKLSDDTNPEEEDDIFFYCGDFAGLCSLVNANGEDFIVIGFEYFE